MHIQKTTDNPFSVELKDNAPIKNSIQLFGLILLCLALVFFAPGGIAQMVFLILLPIAFFSKRNEFWLAALLVFIDNPAYIFFGTGLLDVGRAPLYSIASGVSFSFPELLAIVLVVKSLLVKSPEIPKRFFNSKPLVLAAILAFAISFAFSLSLASMVVTFRRMLMFLFIMATPRLLKTSEQWYSFLLMVLPLTFVAFADQIHTFVQGFPILRYLNPNLQVYHAVKGVEIGSDEVSRALSGSATNYIAFCGSLILLGRAKSRLRLRRYLYVVVVCCFLQIFLSATRGWFSAYAFILILFFLLTSSRVSSFWRNVSLLIMAIPILLLTQTSDVVNTQTNNAWTRISSIQKMAEGDLTAGGTLGRLTDVLPQLLEYSKESPILGYGFSQTAYELENDHSGIANPLIIFGVVGYALILYYVMSIVAKLYGSLKYNPNLYIDKQSIIVCILSILGLVIIHLSSRQVFGLNKTISLNYLVAIIISVANWLHTEQYKDRKLAD